jgi:sugar phosphate isomerase/epimerase
MTRQFSLAHFTLFECAPPELARIASQAGYDFIGLRVIPIDRPGEPRYQLAEDGRLRRETKQALADTGIRLLDIEIAQISERLDPQVYLPTLEVAADLGARFLLAAAWTPDRACVIDRFGALCELAQPLGITVVLEFMSFADVATLGQAIDIVRSAGRENAGILIDALHCHSAGTSLEDLTTTPPEWIHYAHICDAAGEIPKTREGRQRIAREQRLFPGEGGIDVAGLVNRLPPDIVYALEVPNPDRVRALGAQEYARQCLAVSRNYLNERTFR